VTVAYSSTTPGTSEGTDGTTGSTTLTETFGAAPGATDVIVAFIVGRGGTSRTFTADTGSWTLIDRTDQGSTTALESYWRLGDGSTTAFQFGNDSSSEDWGVSMIAISGANTASPIGGTGENSFASGTGVSVSLTPTGASASVPSLVIGCWGNVGNHTWTADAAMTQRWDFKSNTFSNMTSAGGHDTAVITSTGGISRQWTASGSASNCAQLIEIKGAAVVASMPAFRRPWRFRVRRTIV
jgi:hypothetical protein